MSRDLLVKVAVGLAGFMVSKQFIAPRLQAKGDDKKVDLFGMMKMDKLAYNLAIGLAASMLLSNQVSKLLPYEFSSRQMVSAPMLDVGMDMSGPESRGLSSFEARDILQSNIL